MAYRVACAARQLVTEAVLLSCVAGLVGVALVGATGVGKTTNLAKLGALYSVQERARVGVITTDTYRVAASDDRMKVAVPLAPAVFGGESGEAELRRGARGRRTSAAGAVARPSEPRPQD